MLGFILFVLPVIVIVSMVVLGLNGDRWFGHGGHEDFADFEIKAAMGDRDYFTDDPARNYDTYYAQLTDAALMGDEMAAKELWDEFGEEE